MEQQDLTADYKPDHCLVCGVHRSVSEDGTYLIIQGQRVYFCEAHIQAFVQGHNIGRTSMHHTVVNLLSDLEDNARGWDLKQKIYTLMPNSKIELLEKRRMVKLADKSPQSMYAALQEIVVGQDSAKKQISLSVYRHLQALKNTSNASNIAKVPDKHNILLLGPSGCGKTLLAMTTAQYLELPFVTGDASSLSPSGYIGGDADQFIGELLEKSANQADIAQRGCVFLDEVDKIATSQAAEGRGHMAINTQATLLKLIEGKTVKTPNAHQAMLTQTPQQIVDTSNMLWFFGGAFPGLADIVAKKMGYSGKRIGFARDNDNSMRELEQAIQTYEILSKASMNVLVDSLIEYGLGAEFVGRIPTIAPLAPLNRQELMRCLCEIEHSPVKRQQRLFTECGYEIEFEQELLDSIVEEALKMATGTRALNTLVNQSVMQASFNLLGAHSLTARGKVVITKECLSDSSAYRFTKKTRKSSKTMLLHPVLAETSQN